MSVAARPASRSDAGGAADRTAVIAALPDELRALRRRVAVDRGWREGDCRIWEGRLGSHPVVLAATGDGALRAGRGARAVLALPGVRRLVVLGVAGGLDRQLGPGVLVVARRVVDAEGRPAPPPDPAAVAAALAGGGVEPATLVSVPRILWTAEQKAQVRRGLANGDPAACDLETAAFACAAARQGVPYVAVRAISDTATERLPFDPARCTGDAGGTSRVRVVMHALLRPWSFAALWQLRRRVAACSVALADWTERSIPWTSPQR